MRLLLAVALAIAIAGCAMRGGLFSPGIERVCIGNKYGECFLRSDADTVNRRCTRGKLKWDDGSLYDPTDTTKWASCCTILVNPNSGRYKYWVTKGEEECWAHERCHVKIWEADGYKFFAEHHVRCHDFGLGRPKHSLN